ncbi:hypothetical protein [Nocardia sp. NPDC004260]
MTGLRKLVVGDRQFRIIFAVDTDSGGAVVWTIGERADDHCYELALARVQMYAQDPVLIANFQRLIARVRS